MAAFLCANFVAVVLLSWMPKFVHDRFHLDLAASGLAATAFAQLASFAGAITGGWLADRWRAKSPRGRILVQSVGVFCGAPFVVLCGMSQSVPVLLAALTAWGFFKGLYDANIFASVFDVIRPEARGTAAGFMNTVGWLGGGGSAPLVIGIIAQSSGLGIGIALASVVYLIAGALLLTAAFGFVRRDSEKMSKVIAHA
jgi:sugar phosphate permease